MTMHSRDSDTFVAFILIQFDFNYAGGVFPSTSNAAFLRASLQRYRLLLNSAPHLPPYRVPLNRGALGAAAHLASSAGSSESADAPTEDKRAGSDASTASAENGSTPSTASPSPQSIFTQKTISGAWVAESSAAAV